MELPNVISDPEQYYDVDGALANNLDTEGLLRLRTVELTIKYFEGKQANIETFNKQFEEIYKFLTKKENGTTT